jgi:hypothetical protein
MITIICEKIGVFIKKTIYICNDQSFALFSFVLSLKRQLFANLLAKIFLNILGHPARLLNVVPESGGGAYDGDDGRHDDDGDDDLGGRRRRRKRRRTSGLGRVVVLGGKVARFFSPNLLK